MFMAPTDQPLQPFPADYFELLLWPPCRQVAMTKKKNNSLVYLHLLSVFHISESPGELSLLRKTKDDKVHR